MTNIKYGFILVVYIKHKNMYTKRTIEDVMTKTSNTFPVVLITEPRQVGKLPCLKTVKTIVENMFLLII